MGNRRCLAVWGDARAYVVGSFVDDDDDGGSFVDDDGDDDDHSTLAGCDALYVLNLHLGQRSPACKVSCGEHCPRLDGTSKRTAQNVPTCPGSVLPAAWLRLGATAVPWVRQSRFLAVGFSAVWVQVSQQSPRARAALGVREQHPGAARGKCRWAFSQRG